MKADPVIPILQFAVQRNFAIVFTDKQYCPVINFARYGTNRKCILVTLVGSKTKLHDNKSLFSGI